MNILFLHETDPVLNEQIFELACAVQALGHQVRVVMTIDEAAQLPSQPALAQRVSPLSLTVGGVEYPAKLFEGRYGGSGGGSGNNQVMLTVVQRPEQLTCTATQLLSASLRSLREQGLVTAGLVHGHGLAAANAAVHILSLYGDTSHGDSPTLPELNAATVVVTSHLSVADRIRRHYEGTRRVLHIGGGVNRDRFNPQADFHIPANFSLNSLSAKLTCKRALQRSLNLPLRDQQLLIVLDADAQRLVEGLTHPHVQLVVMSATDNAVQRQHFAGADVWLGASTGNNLLKAMCYGVVPCVSRNLGQDVGVVDYDAASHSGTGVIYEKNDAPSLQNAIARCLALYADRPQWERLMSNSMASVPTWSTTAARYVDLYHRFGAPSLGA